MLVLLADRPAHGYALIGRLQEMGVTDGAVDVGQVYKTLRDLEEAGHVSSRWSDDPTGPRRRDYALTETGRAALAEWAEVLGERRRLIGDFASLYRADGEQEP